MDESETKDKAKKKKKAEEWEEILQIWTEK